MAPHCRNGSCRYVHSNHATKISLSFFSFQLREPGLMYGEHAAVSLDDSNQSDENKANNWNANVYSYHFVDKDQETQQAVRKMNQNTKKVNDWDSNVYSYHFVDQDQKTEEAVRNMDKNAKLETNANDWNANVYSYHFVDQDQKTEEAVKNMQEKNVKLETNANDWNANVYSYHFVDKDEETEQAILKIKDDIGKADSKVWFRIFEVQIVFQKFNFECSVASLKMSFALSREFNFISQVSSLYQSAKKLNGRS